MRGKVALINYSVLAQLVLMVSGLTGCANQNLSNDQSLATSANAVRSRLHSTVATRAVGGRKIMPSSDERERSRVSPEIVTGSAASPIPDNAKPTGMNQSDSASEAGLALASPDPRTVQAMNCRDLMVKEHPTALFSERGSAAAQRDYFDNCMKRAGNTP